MRILTKIAIIMVVVIGGFISLSIIANLILSLFGPSDVYSRRY